MIQVPFNKIVVAGGTGFLGSRVVEALRRTSVEEIVVMSRGCHQAVWLDPKVRHCNYDWRRDPATDPSLRKVLAGTNLVINLMAETSNLQFQNHPTTAYSHTIIPTSWLLEGMRKEIPEADLMHVSSDAVYGSGRYQLVQEQIPQGTPATLYGAVKAGQDKLVDLYRQETDMDVITVVPCTLFGERQPSDKCLPSLVRTISRRGTAKLGGQTGGMSSRPDFTARPWLYVDRCADMMVAILENWRGAQDLYFLAPEETLTTRELANIVAEELEMDGDYPYLVFQEPAPKIIQPKRIWDFVKRKPDTREDIRLVVRELRLKLLEETSQ